MILDSTDLLNTYGWRLSSATGFLDQPARKKILKVQGYQTKDLKYEGRKVTVTLHQKFASLAAIATGVGNIRTLMESVAIHTVEITEHNLEAFSAVAREGAKVTINKTVATVTITLTEVTV